MRFQPADVHRNLRRYYETCHRKYTNRSERLLPFGPLTAIDNLADIMGLVIASSPIVVNGFCRSAR